MADVAAVGERDVAIGERPGKADRFELVATGALRVAEHVRLEAPCVALDVIGDPHRADRDTQRGSAPPGARRGGIVDLEPACVPSRRRRR